MAALYVPGGHSWQAGEEVASVRYDPAGQAGAGEKEAVEEEVGVGEGDRVGVGVEVTLTGVLEDVPELLSVAELEKVKPTLMGAETEEVAEPEDERVGVRVGLEDWLVDKLGVVESMLASLMRTTMLPYQLPGGEEELKEKRRVLEEEY